MKNRNDVRASAPNSFVRRLIPTVAAATLTFTGCGPEENNGKGDTGTTMMTARDTGNSTADMGNTPSDMGTTTTPDTGTTTTPDTGTMDPDYGPGQPGLTVPVTVDGVLSMEELRAYCQTAMDCNSGYFQESYATVDECATQIGTYIMESLAEYQAYGVECVTAVQANTECIVAAFVCNGLYLEAPQAAYDACYATFDPLYEMFCQ